MSCCVSYPQGSVFRQAEFRPATFVMNFIRLVMYIIYNLFPTDTI